MAYTEQQIEQVWQKGQIVPNYNQDVWRKDACGAWIKRDQYGNRDTKYGWEVDHINPRGPDIISNQRPLQWENNVAKSDGPLQCVVTSRENINVDIAQNVRRQ